MSPIHLRRTGAVLASVGTTTALALLPVAGAQAAVVGQYAAAGEAFASFQGSGGGDCILSSAAGSNNVQSTLQTFHHGTRHASATGNATFTNTLNSADQVTVKTHVDSTMTLKRKHHDLVFLDLTAGGTVAVNHTISGSSCEGSGEALGETEVAFTESKAGWLTLTRDAKVPDSLEEFVVVNATSGKTVTLAIWQGGASHDVGRAKLKPGTYVVEAAAVGVTSPGVGILGKAQPRSSKVAQTVHLHAAFTPLKKKHH